MININDTETLLSFLSALSNNHRLNIINSLRSEKKHVSELARELGMSRSLLYLHLQKLEEAQIIKSQLELMENGKAGNFISLNEFDITLNNELIFNILKSDK